MEKSRNTTSIAECSQSFEVNCYNETTKQQHLTVSWVAWLCGEMHAICQKCPRHALCTLCHLTPEATDSHAHSHSCLMLCFYLKASHSCKLWVILAFWNCAEICITEFWQRQRRQQSLQTYTAPTATRETGENTCQLTGGARQQQRQRLQRRRWHRFDSRPAGTWRQQQESVSKRISIASERRCCVVRKCHERMRYERNREQFKTDIFYKQKKIEAKNDNVPEEQ